MSTSAPPLPKGYEAYVPISQQPQIPPVPKGYESYKAQDDSSPEEPSMLSRAASFVGDTLSKTAKKFNIEDTLDKIEDIGDRLKSGDWSAVHDVINSLPSMQLGNKEGLAPAQLHDFQDTYEKIKSKDYSGATANVLPYILANHEAISGAAEPVTSAVGDAASKAGDFVGDAAGATGTALKGAATGVAKANLRSASIPLHVTSAALSRIPGVGPDLAVAAETAYNGYHAVKGASEALAERAANKEAAAKQAATDAAIAEQRANPRPSLADQAGVADAPVETDQPSSVTPDDIAEAQRLLRAKIASRVKPIPSPSELNASLPTSSASVLPDDIKDIDPGILQGIAQAHGVKNFSSLPVGSSARTSLINIARAVSRDADKATSSSPPPTPSAAQQPTAALTVAPAAVQSLPDDANAAPPPSSLPQEIQRARSAADVVKDASQEYYQPTGRATNGRIIPTPAELGHGIAGTPDSSATLRVAGSENEKAFNVADYLFNEGIKNPAVLDDPTVRESIDKDFMEKARQYGQKAGNAVPRNAYGSVLHGKTLDLAKAHLERLADDERNGRAPKYQDQSDVDLSDLLSQSLQNIKKPSTVSDILK